MANNQLLTKNAGAIQAVGSVIARPVDRIEALVETFSQLKSMANLLTPLTQITHIKEMHQVSFRAVVVDPNVDSYGNGSECYKGFFHDDDERALGKVGLMNIMAAAGIQHVYKKDVADGRETPNFWKVEFCLAVQDFDGLWRQVIESKEYDLRDGAPETLTPRKNANGKTVKDDKGRTVMVPVDANRLNEMRKHGYRRCETCALEAAVRAILSLKQKYTIEELAKPFVVPKLVFVPDMSDPTVRKMVVAQGLSGANKLYGHDLNVRLLHVPSDVEALPSPPASEPPAAPPEEQVMDTSPESECGKSEPEQYDAEAFPELSIAPRVDTPKCACAHGCDKQLSKEVAEMTSSRVGSPRCAQCYPGKDWDSALHRQFDRTGMKINGRLISPTEADVMAATARRRTAA